MYFICHIVTVIYSCPLSNYLREGKDEGFDGFGLNRFGGGPEGGLGGPIDARGRFLGTCLFGIAGGTDFFGISANFCLDVNRVLALPKDFVLIPLLLCL